MFKMEMRFNGKKITSGNQLQRELTKAVEKHTETALKKAAGPGVRLKKVAGGFVAEGGADNIERLRRRLRRDPDMVSSR